MELKYDPKTLSFKANNYDMWFQNKESPDKKEPTDREESTDLTPLPTLEGDEVKEKKVLKILTPNKLLTRLPILLAQIKTGDNW